MLKVPIVTIDGPAASGKSSVARAVAQKLGWSWLSTGAFYRGLALVAQKCGVSLDDEMGLVELATSSRWSVKMAPEQTLVIFEGQDVTDQIYSEAVGADASKLSHYAEVRKSMLQAQRDCLKGVKGLVAEGRDCGTVVFPSADVKIYLTAKSDSRAERRAREEGLSVEETKAKQSQRDRQDSTRASAPLQVPENAAVVDTSDMDLNQVIEFVQSLVAKSLKLHSR